MNKILPLILVVALAGCLGAQPDVEQAGPPAPVSGGSFPSSGFAKVPLPDVDEVRYRVTGRYGPMLMDYNVSYRMEGNVLTADAGGNLGVLKAGIDGANGLVDWVEAVVANPSSGGLKFEPGHTVQANATQAAPLVGFRIHEQRTPWTLMVPPPSWLDSSSSAAILGKPIIVSRTPEAVSIEACGICRAINWTSVETWTQDHAMFPQRYYVQLIAYTSEYYLNFTRITPAQSLPTWPHYLPPSHIPLDAPRKEWANYPPLGDGPVGRQLTSFLTALDLQQDAISFDRGDVVWAMSYGQQAYLKTPTPVPEPDAIAATADIYTRDDATVVGIGMRQNLGLVDGPWQIAHSRADGTIRLPPDRPPLVALSDILERHGVKYEPGGPVLVVDILVHLQGLPVVPAQAAIASWLACDNGKGVGHFASMYTGEELFVERYTNLDC